MRGILLKIRELRRSKSPAIRSIAEEISRDPASAAIQTIRGLAKTSHTSPSTVVRFCKKMGCAGYRELQRALLFELATIEDSADVALEGIEPQDATEEILAKVVRSTVRSLEATQRLLDSEVLDACVSALQACRTACLFGVGASLLAARDLELKLNRVDKQCHVYEDWHSQLLCARNLHPDDLAIVFSYSGLTREMVEIARCAKKRGARVIAITRVVGSELGDEATWVLALATSEPLVRSGAMASRASQLMIVDALYALYVARDYERCTHIMLHNFDEKRPKGMDHA
ncbi:MurR/RpiR family transcriptional regulator [Collinsella sp. AGMB00827]|uniref:MurR/RpiR family transcriptional regulator n=1 Tax=Collinsella ureilytica TaxID=2869515 RepID=A0ABS7MJK5_9ACTN|nr:MurR/RpiR family transcriptional regulator [Collinsella urealyticum]MBY4797550.1 MurR/RpiR family transcriptional regulator [Collinsella urealyticum]